MAHSILDYISQQQKPQTDVLIGKVAIAGKGGATLYESVNKKTGADSGRIVINYLEGSKIGVIQKVGYIGQRLFASISLYTFIKSPYSLVAPSLRPTVREILIGIEKLEFDNTTLKTNQIELYATGTINIRSSASVSSLKVESYTKGEIIGYTDGTLITSKDTISSKKWYRITTSSGKTAFVREDVVSKIKPAATPIPKPVDNTNKVQPSPAEKSSELNQGTMETDNKPIRKAAIWGGVFLVVTTVTFWLINKVNGSKHKKYSIR